MDRAVPLAAGLDAVIPPDIEAFGAQRLDHADHAARVFLLVGNEDVRHATARRDGILYCPFAGRTIGSRYPSPLPHAQKSRSFAFMCRDSTILCTSSAPSTRRACRA